jgi:hypothetical protein
MLVVALDGAAARARLALNALQQASESVGVASTTRAMWREQVKQWESQLDLISTLRARSAGARQLDSRLSGKIEVRATYFDASSENSPPILQFGRP